MTSQIDQLEQQQGTELQEVLSYFTFYEKTEDSVSSLEGAKMSAGNNGIENQNPKVLLSG